MTVQFDVRLVEMPMPDGEISVADLVAISGRLQELSTRVSRWIGGIDGAGRGSRAVEAAAALRISGIAQGSTTLRFKNGTHDALDFDMPFEREVSTRFWEIVAAIGNDAPPVDAPVNVRESAVALLDSLQHAAPLVEVTRNDGARVTFRPGERDRSVWMVQPPTSTPATTSVVGRLEMVDLRARRFRLADDVGNRVTLEQVDDAEAVSRELVGRRTAATGVAVRDSRGRVTSIESPELHAVDVPDAWQRPGESKRWVPDTAMAGPDPNGGVDFDDDEWETFLAAVRGA
ncbi:hypothetical protein [Promicromonospora soli]